jgi:hypothetical protein
METLSSWCTAIKLAATTADAPLFFDQNTTALATDLLPIMRLLVSERLEDAGLASWMWPTIANARLHHNVDIEGPVRQPLNHTTISATVGWLTSMTDTHQQAIDAYNLVNQLAMRPEGWGIFGPKTTKAKIIIAVPPVSTLGQLLIPFALATTTMDATSLAFPKPSSTRKQLVTAAAAGCEFVYSVSAVASTVLAQDWWSLPHKQECQTLERHACATADGRWRLGQAAARLRSQVTNGHESAWSANVRTPNIGFFRTSAYRAQTTALITLGTLSKLYADDPMTALFAKLTPRIDTRPIRLRKTVLVDVVGQGMQPWHATKFLSDAGAAIGLMTIDADTQTVVSTQWLEPEQTIAMRAPQSTLIEDQKCVLVTRFSNSDKLTNFWAQAEIHARGTWYHEQYDNDDAMIEDDITPFAEHDTPAAGPTTKQTRIGSPPVEPASSQDPREADDSAEGRDDMMSEPKIQTTQSIPPAVMALVKQDRMIEQIVACSRADILKTPRTTIGPAGFSTWTIPMEVANDTESMQWLLHEAQKLKKAQATLDIDKNVDKLISKIIEQIHTNEVRKLTHNMADPPGEKDVEKQAQEIISAVKQTHTESAEIDGLKEAGNQVATPHALPDITTQTSGSKAPSTRQGGNRHDAQNVSDLQTLKLGGSF